MAKLRKGGKGRRLKRGGAESKSEEEEKELSEKEELQSGGRKTRKSKRKANKKTKRKMNGFMKMMLDAKKHNKPSFVYKGKKYKQGKTKTGLEIYKKG